MKWSFKQSVLHTTGLAGLAVTLFGATLTAQAAPQLASFAPAVHYHSGGTGGPGPHANAGTAGDFNGDGLPDLAIPDYFSGQGPRIMLNLGGGVFQSPGTVVNLAPMVGVVEAADLNGDGKDELIASNYGNVWVLSRNAGGSFQTLWSTTLLQGGQEGVEVADLNGDGNPDLAVQLEYGIQVFPGNGNGTFGSGILTAIPDPTISGFGFGNLNNDGVPDMVVALAFTANSVLSYLGNGDGSFTLTGAAATPLVPGAVMLGDLNSDGTDDVTVLAEFTPTQNIIVLISDGSGGFGLTSTRYNGGTFTGNADMADVNADGIPDVIVPDVTTSKVNVLVGDGNGGLVNSGSYAVTFTPQTPAIADFDLNGKADIAVAGIVNWYQPATRVSFLRNTTP